MNELISEVVAEEVQLPATEETPPVDETQPAEEETPAAVDEKPDATELESKVQALEEKRKKLEEDTRYWREQKAAERAAYFKEKQGIEPPPPATPAATNEPDPNTFDDYNEYVKALTDHRVNVAKQEWDRQAEQRSRSQETQQKELDLHTKLQRGFEKYGDFEDVALAETVPITPVIKDILADCDAPEDVAYYLGTNRAEAIRISRMTPFSAAREIAKIEIGLTGTPTRAAPTKPTTQAPAPIRPLGSSNTVTKDPEKMTNKEYNAWRLSQGAKPY